MTQDDRYQRNVWVLRTISIKVCVINWYWIPQESWSTRERSTWVFTRTTANQEICCMNFNWYSRARFSIIYSKGPFTPAILGTIAHAIFSFWQMWTSGWIRHIQIGELKDESIYKYFLFCTLSKEKIAPKTAHVNGDSWLRLVMSSKTSGGFLIIKLHSQRRAYWKQLLKIPKGGHITGMSWGVHTLPRGMS